MIESPNEVYTSTGIMQIGDIAYAPEAKAIFMMESTRDNFEVNPVWTLNIGPDKVVCWGLDNRLPNLIMEKVEDNEIVSQNLKFKADSCYAQGVHPKIRVYDGKVSHLEDCKDPNVLQFFEDNDIKGYFHEQCYDAHYFKNVFPEIILSKDLSKIVSLRSKEALYSRWGLVDPRTGNLVKHFYSDGWNYGQARVDNTTVSEVLNRYNPLKDLQDRIRNRRVAVPRYILQCSPQTPGHTYYQWNEWWAIFRSGWYDHSMMIPKFKNALMKNGLSVRYVFYISPKYWNNIFNEEKIDKNDPDAVKARKTAELDKFSKFLSGDKNSGKGLMAVKEMIAAGNSAVEEKYITIETITVDIKGGEFLEDASEVNSIMSYGMGVQHSLIASSFGNSKGSMSGTDKRELFMINSAMMQPIRDKLLRPFYLIKRFNNWPADLEFVVPDYDFTTLDKNPAGKQLQTPTNNAPQ